MAENPRNMLPKDLSIRGAPETTGKVPGRTMQFCVLYVPQKYLFSGDPQLITACDTPFSSWMGGSAGGCQQKPPGDAGQ